MKAIALFLASACIVLGMGLLAWVSYDATSVLGALGLQARMDEATVAVLALSLGIVLAGTGAFLVRRIRAAALTRTA